MRISKSAVLLAMGLLTLIAAVVLGSLSFLNIQKSNYLSAWADNYSELVNLGKTIQLQADKSYDRTLAYVMATDASIQEFYKAGIDDVDGDFDFYSELLKKYSSGDTAAALVSTLEQTRAIYIEERSWALDLVSTSQDVSEFFSTNLLRQKQIYLDSLAAINDYNQSLARSLENQAIKASHVSTYLMFGNTALALLLSVLVYLFTFNRYIDSKKEPALGHINRLRFPKKEEPFELELPPLEEDKPVLTQAVSEKQHAEPVEGDVRANLRVQTSIHNRPVFTLLNQNKSNTNKSFLIYDISTGGLRLVDNKKVFDGAVNTRLKGRISFRKGLALEVELLVLRVNEILPEINDIKVSFTVSCNFENLSANDILVIQEYVNDREREINKVDT